MSAYFQGAFDQVVCYPLISNYQLKRLYRGKGYTFIPLIYAYLKRLFVIISTSQSDILFIEKESFPYIPARFELFLLRKKKYILDYDDSIFHNYDLSSSL